MRLVLLLPIALATRTLDDRSARTLLHDPDDAENPTENSTGTISKLWGFLTNAYEADAVISFSGKPYDYTNFYHEAWNALPLSMYEGDLTISGPVYSIIKLLESRELPISCPTLWAERGWHVYLSVTKPKRKAGVPKLCTPCIKAISQAHTARFLTYYSAQLRS